MLNLSLLSVDWIVIEETALSSSIDNYILYDCVYYVLWYFAWKVENIFYECLKRVMMTILGKNEIYVNEKGDFIFSSCSWYNETWIRGVENVGSTMFDIR